MSTISITGISKLFQVDRNKVMRWKGIHRCFPEMIGEEPNERFGNERKLYDYEAVVKWGIAHGRLKYTDHGELVPTKKWKSAYLTDHPCSLCNEATK